MRMNDQRNGQDEIQGAERPGSLGLPETDYSQLVPGGREYFVKSIREYTEQLFNEAKNIEDIEHAGSGPPEITAAHVEEAKWVLIRRRRRQARSTRWTVILRIGMVLMSAAVGIGASNFTKSWGAVLCVVCVFIGSMLLVVEREITREL